MKKQTYLVSQDLWMLFTNWAKEFGFRIPAKTYFAKLSQKTIRDLQLIFDKEKKNVEVKNISFNRMQQGLQRGISLNPDSLVVSLDKVYLLGDFQMEINRIVSMKDGEWKDLGEHSRPGFESIEQQLDRIGSRINGKSAIVVDDGCWSGGSISRVVEEFLSRNVQVEKVLVGIFIDSDNKNFSLDVPLEFVFRFPVDSIIDWICERDFLPGTPFGGRTVFTDSYGKINQKSYGAYYLFGMGDYARWASLQFEKDLVKWFTQQCIKRSIKLFKMIERLSGKLVLMSDLSRLPYGVEFDYHERFIDVLKRQI